MSVVRVRGPGNEVRPEDLFQTMLRHEAASQHALAPLDPEAELVPVAAEMRSAIEWVQDDVNNRIAPGSDQSIYGVRDYWIAPLSGRHALAATAIGDCEDYVLEKRARLLALGVPASSLAIVTALAPGRDRHAILVVRLPSRDYALDNLRTGLTRIDELPYTWLAFQIGADLMRWYNARVA